VPADHQPPSYEVLAALVVSLRRELADAVAELARAQGRIAELEDRLRKTSRFSELQAIVPGAGSRRLFPPAGVPDRVGDQVEVGMVEAGDGLAQADGCAGGEAGGQAEDGGLAA